MKRKKLLLLILTSFFICFLSFKQEPVLASEQDTKEKLLRQVEILKREISVLQSLLLNFQLRQDISASSYIALNLSNGSVVLEKNSFSPYSMASITKLMTAVVAIENISKEQKIVLAEEMLRPFGHSPVLYEGLSVSSENLIKATLIQSSNDAAEALVYSLGKQKFLELMNQKAKELKMENTVYYDAHGLSPKNRSTSSDIAKLLKYIYKNHPDILAVTKENNFWLPDPSGTQLKFQNVNNFYYLPYFVGGKTGYILESRQTLASVFKVNRDPVAIVVLNSGNRQADVFSILRKIP